MTIIKRSKDNFSFVEPKIIPIKQMNSYRSYGPITSLLENPTVTEVLINGAKEIYYEKEGKLNKSKVTFENNQNLTSFIEAQLTTAIDRVNRNDDMVYAKLPGGVVVDAIFPPLAIHGPVMIFRKWKKNSFTNKQILDNGTFSSELILFAQKSVKDGLNIVVSGERNSGKTSTLNLLSSFIADGKRIFTIEDEAELTFSQDHVLRFETRSSQIERVAIRDLLKKVLQMRPEHLIVGEIVGSEAYDLLKAMNKGQEGLLTTICAKTPADALSKFETMVISSGRNLPTIAIRSEIVRSIDLIMHQSLMKDGTRKITQIVKVDKLRGSNILLENLFVRKERMRGEW